MRSALFTLALLAATPAPAEDYRGPVRLWFTLASSQLVTGTAGRGAGMERFPQDDAGLGDVRTECFGYADAAGLGRGQCLNTVQDGDFWVETYACSRAVLPPPGAFAACEGQFTVLGGTGRFAAIRGQGHFTMLTTTVAPDGMQVVFAPGEIELHW